MPDKIVGNKCNKNENKIDINHGEINTTETIKMLPNCRDMIDDWLMVHLLKPPLNIQAQIPLGSSRHDSTCRTSRASLVEPCCSTSSTAKMHGLDTSNVSRRDVTWWAKWNLGFTAAFCLWPILKCSTALIFICVFSHFPHFAWYFTLLGARVPHRQFDLHVVARKLGRMVADGRRMCGCIRTCYHVLLFCRAAWLKLTGWRRKKAGTSAQHQLLGP